MAALNPKDLLRQSFPWSVTLGLLAILIIGQYYWQTLPIGCLHHTDEYLTLDRSNAFLIKKDWLTVYSLNQPTFKKPPLQYWLTALSMKNSVNTIIGLRLPSYLFGLMLLMVTGFLAY